MEQGQLQINFKKRKLKLIAEICMAQETCLVDKNREGGDNHCKWNWKQMKMDLLEHIVATSQWLPSR